MSGFKVISLSLILKKKHPVIDVLCLKYPNKDLIVSVEGVTPTITGTMGTLQANEVLNSILKVKSNLEKKILIFNSLEMNFRKINLKYK